MHLCPFGYNWRTEIGGHGDVSEGSVRNYERTILYSRCVSFQLVLVLKQNIGRLIMNLNLNVTTTKGVTTVGVNPTVGPSSLSVTPFVLSTVPTADLIPEYC